jgi:methyl-accepting chemotaxis protein
MRGRFITMPKEKNKIGITAKLLGLAILPSLISTLIILVIGRNSLITGISYEGINGLEMLAQATIAGYSNIEGDYHLDNDGDLWKGTDKISDKIDDIDQYVDGIDADITICYGKTRKLTTLRDAATGERIINTDVSDEVWNTVKNGETYTTTNIKINNENYYACYVPLRNSDNSVIGIVFAGQPSTLADTYINEKVREIALVAGIVLLLAIVIGYIVSTNISKCLVKTKNSLQEIAEGNLAITISRSVLKRKDEIGQMGWALKGLVDKLTEIVGQLKESADVLYNAGQKLDDVASHSSSAADEISIAVEDISKGAVSQAEEIQNASGEINTMGNVIESIVDNVGTLAGVSKNMSSAGDASMVTIKELSESNDRTTDSIARIAEQIQNTNVSIQKISEAAELITFITDQTSLLALNASIESARAGEAGKGFAVVATEIQNLAVQSEEAAREIQNVIKTLEDDSQKTIRIMNEATTLVRDQQDKLEATKKKFSEVSEGIGESKENTEVIHEHTNECNEAREQVMEVIANLSDISQQNAASAEETTASMQELNATINVMSESARNLKKLSADLNKAMEFFKI